MCFLLLSPRLRLWRVMSPSRVHPPRFRCSQYKFYHERGPVAQSRAPLLRGIDSGSEVVQRRTLSLRAVPHLGDMSGNGARTS
jgi:hypothetical protein